MGIKGIVLAALAAWLIAAARQPAVEQPEDTAVNEVIHINTIEGVIFQAENLTGQQAKLPFSGELWTPSRAQVIELEEKLPAALHQLLADRYADYIVYDLPTYIRQYAGGEAYIWTGFICSMFDGLPNYWQFIQTGTGACYFHLVWHPASGTFSQFTGSAS